MHFLRVAGLLFCWTSWIGVASAQPAISFVNDRHASLPIAPGNVALIVGEGLSLPDSLCFLPANAWPLTVPDCGVTVFVNGQPVPIGRIIKDNQVVVQIPLDDPAGAKVAAGPVEFVVQVGEERSEPFVRELVKFNPVLSRNPDAFFVVPPVGEFRRTNSFLVTAESPAEPGEVLTISVDGIGPSTPSVPPGTVGPVDPPAVANITPRVIIQDIEKLVREAQVVSTIVSPTKVGFYDLTFVVPPDLPASDAYSFVVEVEDDGEVFTSRPVGLAVGQFPHEITGVLDAAEFGESISPGSLASVFGLFATKDIAAQGVPLNLEEDGFSITFDGLPAGILTVNRLPNFDQANVHVPPNLDVTDGKVDVQVHWNQKGALASESFEVDAAPAAPGIYSFDGFSLAIIQNVSLGDDDVIHGSFAHVENSIGTAFGEQPAPVGGVLTIWCNGLGPVTGAVATGDVPGLGNPLLETVKPIRVIIDGWEAEILGAPILHPTLVGTFQINVRMSDRVRPDPITFVRIEIDFDGTLFQSKGGMRIATRAKP